MERSVKKSSRLQKKRRRKNIDTITLFSIRTNVVEIIKNLKYIVQCLFKIYYMYFFFKYHKSNCCQSE